MSSTRSLENKSLILVVGPERSGKTSVVDLLVNDVSLGATSPPPVASHPDPNFHMHPWLLEGKECILVDTPPLNEFIPAFDDFIKIHAHNIVGLIFLNIEGFIHLDQKNAYQLARKIADACKAPLILGVTYSDMYTEKLNNKWYENNKDSISELGWKFDNVAPICTQSLILCTPAWKEYFAERRTLSREYLMTAIKKTIVLDERMAPVRDKPIINAVGHRKMPFRIFSKSDDSKKEKSTSWWAKIF